MDNFDINIESDNLKTVMLKIGEIDPNKPVEEWYKNQPRDKRQKLSGIKKRLSTKQKYDLIQKANVNNFNMFETFDPTLDNWNNYKKLSADQKGNILDTLHKPVQNEYREVPKNIVYLQRDLIELDKSFRKYFETRKQLLEAIWSKQGGINTNMKSLKDSFLKINEYTYKEIEINKRKVFKIANAQDKELKPDDIYQHVKKIFEKEIHQYNLHNQFLSNLWSDVANQYHGYINKFFETEYIFEKNKSDFVKFVEETIKTLEVTETRNPYHRERSKLKNITPTILRIYSDRNKINIHNFNLTISEFKIYIKLWYDQYPDSQFNPIAKIWQKIQELSSGSSSIKIKFDHEKSFPRFKDTPKVQDLIDEVENLFPDTSADWYTARLKQLNTKNPILTPFRDSYLTPTEDGNKEIPDNDLTPNATAHKFWTKNYRTSISSRIATIYDLAIKNEDEIWNKFKNQPNNSKDFMLLRKLAGWIAVRAIAVSLPLKTIERNNFVYYVNLICSQIQTGYKEFESEFHRESIYLSGMYRDLDNSCSYLCTNNDQNKLFLLLDFENTIYKGNSSVNTLIYTDENNKEYVFDSNNPEDYINYNKANWKAQNVDLSSSSLFNLPLHFGVNQSRKYFWNNVRGIQNKKGEKPKDKDGNEIENNQIHNIFNPNSRLKVSSMRLIRKFNPIREVWEYYLSLAIYRLEEANEKCLPKEIKNEIVGVDIGTNKLVDFASIEDGKGFERGFYINKNVENMIVKASEFATKTITEFGDLMDKKNYISPEKRVKISRSLTNAVRQSSAIMVKEVLNGKKVILEDITTNDKTHLDGGKDVKEVIRKTLTKKYHLNQKTSQKLQHELPNELFSNQKSTIKYDIKHLFGIAPTQSTSQICSCCGHNSRKLVDKQKIIDYILSENQILDLKNCIKREECNPRITGLISHYITHLREPSIESFIFDIKKLDSDESNNSLRERRLKLQEIQSQEEKYKKVKDYIYGNQKGNDLIYSSRPSWFYENSEKFRCLVCGSVTECDRQASLNIARFKLFIIQELDSYVEDNTKNKKDQIINLKKIPDKKMLIDKLENDLVELEKEIVIRFAGVVENQPERFETWYQTQLAKHGYDENGNSKWNITPTELKQ